MSRINQLIKSPNIVIQFNLSANVNIEKTEVQNVTLIGGSHRLGA